MEKSIKINDLVRDLSCLNNQLENQIIQFNLKIEYVEEFIYQEDVDRVVVCYDGHIIYKNNRVEKYWQIDDLEDNIDDMYKELNLDTKRLSYCMTNQQLFSLANLIFRKINDVYKHEILENAKENDIYSLSIDIENGLLFYNKVN